MHANNYSFSPICDRLKPLLHWQRPGYHWCQFISSNLELVCCIKASGAHRFSPTDGLFIVCRPSYVAVWLPTGSFDRNRRPPSHVGAPWLNGSLRRLQLRHSVAAPAADLRRWRKRALVVWVVSRFGRSTLVAVLSGHSSHVYCTPQLYADDSQRLMPSF